MNINDKITFNVVKGVMGKKIKLYYEEIENHGAYILFQVYKVSENGVQTPVYKESWAYVDLTNLAKNGFKMGDFRPAEFILTENLEEDEYEES